MPVVTRSCTKQKGRPRIEDETPATTNANRCRYVTRSSAKRKILQQENEGKEEEPPSKVRITGLVIWNYVCASQCSCF